MLRTAAWILVCSLSCLPLAAAQDFNRFDVHFGYGAQSSKTSESFGNTVSLKPTSSGVFLFTVRRRFTAHHALAFNIGHTSNSQVYQTQPLVFRVQTGITEYSGTYSFSAFQTARIEPFVFGGAGILRFNPGNTYINGVQTVFGASSQNKLVFPYGAGLDYRVWRVIAVRLQYRGLIYKAPDFHIANLVTGATGHMAEADAGIVLKF